MYHRLVHRALLALLALLVGACASPACADDGDRRLARDVEILSTRDGQLAEDAQARVLAAGRGAIVMLETGLYTAAAPGRRRIVKTLAALHLGETRPILAHLAQADPDPDVRAAAAAALASPR